MKMPPKKREKESSGDGMTTKLNGVQADQEMFLQAFEKPTQIYRYLRCRNSTKPVFLYRNLTYMRDRLSRNNQRRKNFQVDSLLQHQLNKIRMDKANILGNYLNIIYVGLFDNVRELVWNDDETVKVEAMLYKISHSKRKDTASECQKQLVGISHVNVNPTVNSSYSAVNIPFQSFQPFGDTLNMTYKVTFRIEVMPEINSHLEEDAEEISAKRSKPNMKTYSTEMSLYDKNRCISEGEYEAVLKEVTTTNIKKFSPKKKCTWETLMPDCIPYENKFEVFNKSPTLKFRLRWSNSVCPITLDNAALFEWEKSTTDELIKSELALLKPMTACSDNFANTLNNNNSIEKIRRSQSDLVKLPNGEDGPIQIVYNFLYSNNTRQQTEYTHEVVCPWCGLDCVKLYSLLKHLKLCHARFNFTYHPAENGARIDVTINDAYDGSYAGSPYDLVEPEGCSFARTCGPVRRTTVTNLLVCRPRRQKTCLTEFLELDEDELNNQRPYITGHNRLYHHTETCLPVHPKELDIDSEGENDPLWLRQKTIQMIDEFSDVNEGEKELMKLWNLHIMKNGYVGDCQLPIACEMFLDLKGREIIEKNLYRNFILHMCSLFDYGLVSPEVVYKMIQKLQNILSTYPEGIQLIASSREAQVDYWLKVGVHKQVEQKLKSPHKQIPTLKKSTPNETAVASTSSSSPTKPSKSSGVNSSGMTSSATNASNKKKLSIAIRLEKTMPKPSSTQFLSVSLSNGTSGSNQTTAAKKGNTNGSNQKLLINSKAKDINKKKKQWGKWWRKNH